MFQKLIFIVLFFFSSRRRHTRSLRDWSSDVCSSDLFTVASLILAGLSWWRFSYADGPTAVVVTRGLVSRTVRTVPNDRIRGVDVEASPLHRLFGLVKVRIDAAAGHERKNEQELVIDGVTRAEGERLHALLLARERVAESVVPA